MELSLKRDRKKERKYLEIQKKGRKIERKKMENI
jgi:hypothetical protein